MYIDYEVTALVRNLSNMPEELCKQVKVVIGDVLNPEDVNKVIIGSEAVVVTLGTGSNLGKY